MSERRLKAAFLKGKISLLRDQGKSDLEISTFLGVPRSSVIHPLTGGWWMTMPHVTGVLWRTRSNPRRASVLWAGQLALQTSIPLRTCGAYWSAVCDDCFSLAMISWDSKSYLGRSGAALARARSIGWSRACLLAFMTWSSFLGIARVTEFPWERIISPF